METIGLIISLVLTLMVFSYILDDNPLFKLAEHIFVGSSVGYAMLVVYHLVISPAFIDLRNEVALGGIGSTNLLLKLPPFLFCVLLLFKVFPTQSRLISTLGSITLAFLVGVGAAVAIGGALLGSLYPQAAAVAAINLNPNSPLYANALPFSVGNPSLDSLLSFITEPWLSNLLIILATIGTFFYFTFTHRPTGFMGGFREGFVNFWAGMGRLILFITIGALFANTLSARVALLASRIQFVVQGIQQLSGR